MDKLKFDYMIKSYRNTILQMYDEVFTKDKKVKKGLQITNENMSEIILWLASLPLIRNDKGKVCSSETLQAMKESCSELELRLFSVLAFYPRGKILLNPQASAPRYSAFVPLFMSAHKEYNNVMYEEWDKKDPTIRFMVGNVLYDKVIAANPIVIKDIQAARQKHRDQGYNLLSFRRHKFECEGQTIPATNWRIYLVLQLWLANAELRNKFMILDTDNWDHVPEALDTAPSVSKVIKEKTKPTRKDLPFYKHKDLPF